MKATAYTKDHGDHTVTVTPAPGGLLVKQGASRSPSGSSPAAPTTTPTRSAPTSPPPVTGGWRHEAPREGHGTQAARGPVSRELHPVLQQRTGMPLPPEATVNAVIMRVLAALALLVALTAGLTACNQPAPPTHFGNCPAGQHWEQVQAFPGWTCDQ